MIFVLIVLALLVLGGGWFYLQWSNVREIGIGKIQEVIKKIEENEDIDNFEDIEKLEDIDIEKIKEMSPLIRRIYQMIPENIIDISEDDSNEISNNSIQQSQKSKLDKSENELLPESISSHTSLSLQSYQEFKNISETVLSKTDKEYINKGSVLLEYKKDFPERKIEDLRKLDEVTEEISDSMIEENREQLEKLFNFKEISGWYEEILIKKGWQRVGKKTGYANGLLFKHPEDGYFMILGADLFLYTP